MKGSLRLIAIVLVFVIGASNSAAQETALKHCAVELAPVLGQFNSDNLQLSTVIREGCFESFADAVSFATNGRINLPSNTLEADVLAAVDADIETASTLADRGGGVTPSAVYTLAYMYDWSNLNPSGGTLTVSSSSLCSTNNFYAYNLTNFQSQGNWSNRIESWQRAVGSGCNTGYFYPSVNLVGTPAICGSPCASLGTLNNDSESFALTA